MKTIVHPILLLFFISILKANGQIISTSITPQKLYEKRLEATLKIEIYSKESLQLMSYGTGTYVLKDGLIITNFHVAESFFDRDSLVAISDSKNHYLTEISLISCSDERYIDLCLFKSDVSPKSWFPLRTDQVSIGHQVFKIGNGGGEDFNLTIGHTVARENNIPFLLDYSTNKNGHVEFYEVSANLRPGDSGGPVFDDRGNLVGMSTMGIYLLDPKMKLRIREEQLNLQNFDKYYSNKRYLIMASREISNYIVKYYEKKKEEGTISFQKIKLLSKENITQLQKAYQEKFGPPSQIPLVKNLSDDDFLQLKKTLAREGKGKLIIIDVRSPLLYEFSHLEGAINIPYEERSKKSADFIMANDDFDLKKIKRLVKGEDHLVIYDEGEISWKCFKALKIIRSQSEFENLYWLKSNRF